MGLDTAGRDRITLWLLAFANFVIGMGAFVVIGVLSPVAIAFGVDKAQAGWLMTAYALVYALTSPVLVAHFGHIDKARLVTMGLGIFMVGAFVCAAAPTFEVLALGRMAMALGGGLVTPTAATIGVAISKPEARGGALATVFGGLTLAQVVGVPVGAWLGYALGWRVAFELVVVLALACALLMHRTLPRGIDAPKASLTTLADVLRTPHLLSAVAFTALFIGGIYVVYTYIAALIEARLGFGRDGITAMLLLFGAGAVAGNALGGFLTDRIGPVRTLLLLCLAQMVLMPLVSFVDAGVVALAAAIGLWSVFAWSFMAPQQTRLAGIDPKRTPVLFALNAAAIYLGGSLGSLAGGQTLRFADFDALGPIGAAVVVGAAISLWLTERLRPSDS